MALTHNLQPFASQIPRLLLYIDIDTDSPPAKEYKSIDGLLALFYAACSMRAQRGVFRLRVMGLLSSDPQGVHADMSR